VLEVLCEPARAAVDFLPRVLRAGCASDPMAPKELEAESVDSIFFHRSFIFIHYNESNKTENKVIS